MALETMKDVKDIKGIEEGHIFVDDENNLIAFKIQNGPIAENGKNGCQVEDIIVVAKHMIEGLNKKFSCRENSMIITKLDEAIMWSKKRIFDRTKREVEGFNKE